MGGPQEMAERDIFPMTFRLTAKKLSGSKFLLACAAAFPVFLVFLGARDSYGTAMKFFLYLFPYAFLLATQDLAATELAGRGLENVLFLRGRFKAYLWRKNFVVALLAGAYALALFGFLAIWGLASGTFETLSAFRFGLGLLAGLYYVGVGGALSYILKSGSNIVIILLAQALGFLIILHSALSPSGFIDRLGTGRFPGFVSKLELCGALFLFPNLVV